MNVKGTNQVAQVEKKSSGTLRTWLEARKNDLSSAIPKGTVDVSRFMQSAYLAITNPKNPGLLKCDKESIARALKEAASYGLELNGTLGQAYLIPYDESVKDKNGEFKKVMTAHFQMGYKGLIALARRSNTIKTIAAECIYENDSFECNLASGRSITHKMNIFEERGEVIGYYCLVELTNGGEQFAVMSKKDAEKFRDKYAKSYILAKDKSKQNWTVNFDAMALKTCVIKALKLCPISIEALDAVSKEELKEVMSDEEKMIEAEYQEVIENDSAVAETPVIEEKPKQIESKPAKNVQKTTVQMPEDMEMSAQEEAAINAMFDDQSQQFENGDVF